MNTVILNLGEVDREPMDEEDALALIHAVLHEMYHAFQRQAVIASSRNGVSREQAKKWRKNFANYISHEQNPRLFAKQPVEVDANCFAHAVASRFTRRR